MAALSTIAAIAAIGASAASIGQTLTQKPEKGPSAPPPLPSSPALNPATNEGEAAGIAAQRNLRNKKAAIGGSPSGRASTLLTGASGLSSPAPTERKTLLGL